MGSDGQRAAVACTLGVGDLAERRARWRRLGERAGAGVAATPDGLRLMFLPDPGVDDELAALAELERECCAFAEWSVGRRDGRLALDVTASTEEGVTAVQAMFRDLPTAAP